jgi:hypothetical protein
MRYPPNLAGGSEVGSPCLTVKLNDVDPQPGSPTYSPDAYICTAGSRQRRPTLINFILDNWENESYSWAPPPSCLLRVYRAGQNSSIENVGTSLCNLI